jgi:hypothetical protein
MYYSEYMGKKRGGGQNRLEGSRATSPVLLLRVPPRLLRSIKAAARERNVTPSALVREILEKALERNGRRS